jgi:Flp pilus assembly protein TadD
MNQQQPSQQEIQSLINLFNAGRLAQTEVMARSMLKAFPNVFIIHNVLGVSLEGQGKFAEAATAYQNALKIDPRIAEIHFNLGVVLGHAGKTN